MKPSSFTKAAMLFEDRKVYVYGACEALAHVPGSSTDNAAHISAFHRTFAPREDMSHRMYWGDRWSDKEMRDGLPVEEIHRIRRECRVLALLFAAEMAKTGDLA